MNRRVRRPLLLSALAGCALLPALQAPAQQGAAPTLDAAVEQIKDEGLKRSQVMKIAGYLTDVIGPRLTASPGCKKANEWTRDTMASWGMKNAALESWGEFGRGWTLKSFSMQVTSPQTIPLIAYPKAWTAPTKGSITAPVVYLDIKAEADFEKYKGKLKGAIVLTSAPREVKAHFEPRATRATDAELLNLANADGSRGGRRRGNFQPNPDQRTQFMLAARKARFIHDEAAAVVLEPSRAGDDPTRPTDGGTLFVQSATVPPTGDPNANPLAQQGGRRSSPWDKDAVAGPTQIVVSAEHYNRMVRMIEQGQELKIQVQVDAEFNSDDTKGYNTVAEIPGTDLSGEVVMLGAHLDSWHGATGATDNAAGCAAMMEAARILQTLKLQPRRTIRVALWTGEEQGLLGSRGYVTQHFGTGGGGGRFGGGGGAPAPLMLKPEHAKISAYYNLDNGSGKIRGVYLQGNEACRPIFRSWLAPFRDLGASTLASISVGGTDHGSFDTLGIPAFQFIQDELEYGTRTHHSNQDLFDRLQADDLKQASTLIAAFAYQTAMRDEKLPRKAMPAGR